MMYQYIKALHIIFIVTWFSGMFYIVRLFVYAREAQDKAAPEKSILQKQYDIMMRRLWYGITWPSAVLTLILGLSVWHMLGITPSWLKVKLCFVIGLYLYHFSLHHIFKQQISGIFRYSSQQLRIWNEVVTIFLVAVVMIVVVKDGMSWIYGLVGLLGFIVVLMSAIKIYKAIRSKKAS